MPKDKPVILAANHPSAFMEPCILAVLLPRPLHFLVRGDFFAKPLFNKILRSLHMLPIYRMKDGGYTKIKNNFSTFDRCYSTLEEGKVIMILAEGTTIHEKRLRNLQKGTARLAFGALKKYPDLDLRIVPVGVNYTEADQFRSVAMIQFGQPIDPRNYKEQFEEDANQAIKALTDDLRTALEKNVIHIDRKEDEALVEKLFTINRNDWPEAPQPAVSKNNHLLKSEMKIVRSINRMAPEEKQVLSIKTDAYLDNLKKIGLSDYAVAVGKKPKARSFVVLILGFLPFLVGYIGNYLPIKIADVIISKKVRAIEFRSSVKITTSIVLYLIYFLFLLGLIIFSGNLKIVLLLLAVPFFGYYALLYQEYYKKWRSLQQLEKIQATDLTNLKEARDLILAELT